MLSVMANPLIELAPGIPAPTISIHNFDPNLSCEPNEILAKFKVGEWTNFHMAAYQDWNNDAIYALDVSLINVSDPTDGRNPIHIACQYDNYRFLKIILGFFELEINAQDKNGYTALHIAAKHGHERCLNALVLASGSKQVDLNLGGFDCPTALHLAIANEEIGCVRTLIQAGANINATYGNKARTCLHLAAKKGNEPIVRLLTTYRPYSSDPNNDNQPLACRPALVDAEGKTAMHYAASGNHSGCVDLLIRAGAKVNRRTDEGKTALHIAAEKGYKKTTKLLLKYKIDKDSVDKWGMKAIEYAMMYGHNEVIGILMDFSSIDLLKSYTKGKAAKK